MDLFIAFKIRWHVSQPNLIFKKVRVLKKLKTDSKQSFCFLVC